MRALCRQRAFTLVELMVTLAIMCVVLMASAPFLSDWNYSRQIKDAQSKLLGGYGLAKSLALRNPTAVQSNLAAAGLKVVTGSSDRWLYVCNGDPSSASCSGTDTTGVVVWKANFPTAVVTRLGTSSTASANTLTSSGTTLAVAINNRGVPTGSLVYYYSLTRGGSANDVSGPLL